MQPTSQNASQKSADGQVDSSDSPKELDVSIVVVSFNTRQLVEDCLRSVEKHLDGVLAYEVIVVDNASKDGTPEWLPGFAQGRPRLHVLNLPVNTGFSGGNNAGFKIARGRNVLMLNSDAYLIDSSLKEAVAFLDSRPDLFSVAAMLLTGEGKPGASYGHFPGPGTLARELLAKRYSSLRAVSPDPEEGTHAVDFPCGAYYLIKHSALREVGLMDEAFFVYFEETDLAMRARKKGYGSAYFAPAKAVHLGGQSIQEVKSPAFTRMFYANWKRYLRKHHGPIAMAAVRSMLYGYFLSAAWAHKLRGNGKMAEFFHLHRQCLVEGWASLDGKPGPA
jgi:GT2 family glycosyltransferase